MQVLSRDELKAIKGGGMPNHDCFNKCWNQRAEFAKPDCNECLDYIAETCAADCGGI